jgi:hypothetical protein
MAAGASASSDSISGTASVTVTPPADPTTLVTPATFNTTNAIGNRIRHSIQYGRIESLKTARTKWHGCEKRGHGRSCLGQPAWPTAATALISKQKTSATRAIYPSRNILSAPGLFSTRMRTGREYLRRASRLPIASLLHALAYGLRRLPGRIVPT